LFGDAMANSVSAQQTPDHLLCLENVRGYGAKVDSPNLQKMEKDAKASYGQTLQRAIQLAGYTKSEAAAVMGVDAAQLGRWFAGTETPQNFRFRAHPRLRAALRLAEAEADPDVVIETVIKVRTEKVG
jgi:hypothetical protein